jgi:hypothetical protein
VLIDLQGAESADGDESFMRLADAAGLKKSIRVLDAPEAIVSFLFHFFHFFSPNRAKKTYSDGGVPKPKKLLGGKSGKLWREIQRTFFIFIFFFEKCKNQSLFASL